MFYVRLDLHTRLLMLMQDNLHRLIPCFLRSCYVVFPGQQIVLALGCLMGLVMYARYGEDSPLDKGFVKTNDQVFKKLTGIKFKDKLELNFQS